MSVTFPGFSPQAIAFFEALATNNRKEWFEAHRSDYEECLLEPLKSLVAVLADTMLAIDDELVTMPAVDKTISRIYRDTRFSRDFWTSYSPAIGSWHRSIACCGNCGESAPTRR